jgi:hypothetical protein
MFIVHMLYGKRLAVILILCSTIQGCQPSNNPTSKAPGCSDPSKVKLDSGNVEDATLNSTPKNFSGLLGLNQSKGYRFTGQKGQSIDYHVNSASTCAWLYSADNKLLNSTSLPQNGSYILQVANVEGSGTFQLSMSISDVGTTPQQQKSSSPKSTNSVDLGWLRLGAVNNTTGTASVGETLIKTTQAITIDPPQVPKIGDRVTIVNSVNLRADVPRSPGYKLTEKKGIISPGQKVIVVEITSFVDPTSSSPNTVVWAKIGVDK